MNKPARYTCWLVILITAILCFSNDAEARKKRRRRHYGPPPTHPVVLWSRTLSESTDREQRKVAAFKLSQYSLPIFQNEVVRTLEKCIKDSDVEIKVLCAKAMGRAGTQSNAENIRKVLLERYQADPTLRNTIVRAFMVRRDDSPILQETLLDSLKKSKDQEEQLALCKYFETYGTGNNKLVDALVEVYNKNGNSKVKNAVISVIAARATGQESAIDLLTKCTESLETPLVLNCLSGLQQQAKKDSRAWAAVEKTITSEDPDVLLATLDVISALPETENPVIARRIVQMLEEVDDDDTLEKAVLSLGVCGDRGEKTVEVLGNLLEKKTNPEGVRIAAALVLGKQAAQFPDKPKENLLTCSKSEKSQSLRTACQLGIQELESRKILSAKTPPTPREPTSVEDKNNGDAKAAEALAREPEENASTQEEE